MQTTLVATAFKDLRAYSLTVIVQAGKGYYNVRGHLCWDNPAKTHNDLEAKWIQNETRDLQHSLGPHVQFDTAAGPGV